MNSKFKRYVLYVALIFLLLSVIGLVSCLLLKNTIVVNYGIQLYRNLRVGAIVLVAIAVVSVVVAIVFSKIKTIDKVEFDVDIELCDKATEVCSELRELSRKKWVSEKDKISRIISDIGIVVNYYESLGDEELEVSHAELTDADDVLYKVISAMLHNAEQLLRFMRVMSSNDTTTVHNEVRICCDRNNALTVKAQDFVTSVLGYMRSSDNSDERQALSKICSFKEVILGELDLADKYI